MPSARPIIKHLQDDSTDDSVTTSMHTDGPEKATLDRVSSEQLRLHCLKRVRRHPLYSVAITSMLAGRYNVVEISCIRTAMIAALTQPNPEITTSKEVDGNVLQLFPINV